MKFKRATYKVKIKQHTKNSVKNNFIAISNGKCIVHKVTSAWPQHKTNIAPKIQKVCMSPQDDCMCSSKLRCLQ